jgi:hypothetical protein
MPTPVWEILLALAKIKSPDAKVLLPPTILDRAKNGKYEGCIDVCANLISETDADSLVLVFLSPFPSFSYFSF